jgi:hypothetical protein
MTNVPAFLSILILSTISARAADPAWNVRDAVEKLLDKHALRLTVDDWFLQRTDGCLVQYFRPSVIYTGGGAAWTAEVRTAKWRERKDGKWSAWYGPAIGSTFCQPVVIEISTPSTGGAIAKVAKGYEKFSPFRAPGQSWVTHVR